MDGNELQVSESVQVETQGRVHRLSRKAPIHTQLVTSLLQAAARKARRNERCNKEANDLGSRTDGQLLTVKETASALRVCTATVYGMIERGDLEHVRVSNAIRVVVRSADSG